MSNSAHSYASGAETAAYGLAAVLGQIAADGQARAFDDAVTRRVQHLVAARLRARAVAAARAAETAHRDADIDRRRRALVLRAAAARAAVA